jgi:hypothetical protein
MHTASGLLASHNWDWAETLKNSFTLVELGPLHKKWATKPIGNKSDNTFKNVSDNTLKTKSEWQYTQEMWVTTHIKIMSTTAQNSLQGE